MPFDVSPAVEIPLLIFAGCVILSQILFGVDLAVDIVRTVWGWMW